MSLQAQITNLATRIGTECKAIRAAMGDKTSLTTTDKTSLVAAINELKTALSGAVGILDTASAANQMFRFDVQNRVLSPFSPTDYIQSGTAAIGNRMAAYCALDGTDTYDVVLLVSHLSTIAQELIPLV